MKLHFTLKENGKLYVIQDMPETPDFSSKEYKLGSHLDALQKAKDNAIEVLNQDEVLDRLWRKDERINNPIPFLFWKENMLPYPKDTIYSLECKMEVRDYVMPCPDNKFGCSSHDIKKALITFEASSWEPPKYRKERETVPERPIIQELYADNGSLTGYALIDPISGETLWTDDDENIEDQRIRDSKLPRLLEVEKKLGELLDKKGGNVKEQELWNEVIQIIGTSEYLRNGNDYYRNLMESLKHFSITRKFIL
jgi:hypothetical protein